MVYDEKVEMPRRHFTVTEVNKLIPSLERVFTDVIQLHASLRRCEEQLHSLGVVEVRPVPDEEDTGGSPGVQHAKAMYSAFYEMLLEALGRVAEMGGEVKDPGTGLVDFPGRRGSEDIFLCWQLGERSVTHWHSADAGFAGRRPIAHLSPKQRLPLD